MKWISLGGLSLGSVVLRDGVAPVRAPLPADTLAVRASGTDASRVLMRGFPDHRAVYVWPLTEPTKVTTLAAVGNEYVAAAMWRDAREIVVSLSRTSRGVFGRLATTAFASSKPTEQWVSVRALAPEPDSGNFVVGERARAVEQTAAVEALAQLFRAHVRVNSYERSSSGSNLQRSSEPMSVRLPQAMRGSSLSSASTIP
jgi:hypothetical protein